MRELIALCLLCLILALASLGAMVWGALVMPLLSMDGLLLVAVCLTLAVFFGFCFLWLAYEARLWELVKGRHAVASNPVEGRKAGQ